MNFVNTHYVLHILLGGAGFAFLIFFLNKKYFKWVKTYWFFQRTLLSRLSTMLYILSLVLMLSSLLDLRGPEEKIKTNLPDQKTIIILDSSSSMLAEDIRPSRFGKAIQLARHFVKNAAGHQISIVLFSDIQKRLIPFTDDIDLLDSRLAALEKTNAVSGGSNIGQAIAEAVSYFDTNGDRKTAQGNILVFTDAEESDGSFGVDLGDNINLAVVGIGTAKGGNIPLRWDDGSFRGYKTNKDGAVITKLDEEYIKKIGKEVKNYKYWIANSYSLPTDDIKSFFRSTYNKGNGKSDMRVRPVYSHFILVPAIVMFCVSIFLGRFKTFKVMASFLIATTLSFSLNAYSDESENKKSKPLPPSLISDMQKMKEGKSHRKEVLKIAENLLKNNENDKATELYSEYSKEGDEVEVVFNRATALLKANRIDEAIPLIQEVYTKVQNEGIKEKMHHNLILALNNDKNNKKNDQDNKEDEKKDKDKKENDKDKEGNKDDKKDDKNKEGKQDDKKDEKDKEGSKNDKKDKDQKKGQGQKNEDKKDDEGKEDDKDKDKDKDKEKDSKNKKDLDRPDRQDSAPKTLQEKEKMIEQKRKMVKIPAMVKQILNDDRDLQKKMMDTSTNERGASKPKRDW